ncbi:hypothetical protein VMCG_07299 [Cytospora schulzeri]|uniref:Uncharacterized protein n=1 Tax=Cytospora schulzeri TaxID=448051 RepID=A0A423WAN7_9PEZI|nr:hypothetical protein VMCG_07299 [Valsa malicola]
MSIVESQYGPARLPRDFGVRMSSEEEDVLEAESSSLSPSLPMNFMWKEPVLAWARVATIVPSVPHPRDEIDDDAVDDSAASVVWVVWNMDSFPAQGRFGNLFQGTVSRLDTRSHQLTIPEDR